MSVPKRYTLSVHKPTLREGGGGFFSFAFSEELYSRLRREGRGLKLYVFRINRHRVHAVR